MDEAFNIIDGGEPGCTSNSEILGITGCGESRTSIQNVKNIQVFLVEFWMQTKAKHIKLPKAKPDLICVVWGLHSESSKGDSAAWNAGGPAERTRWDWKKHSMVYGILAINSRKKSRVVQRQCWTIVLSSECQTFRDCISTAKSTLRSEIRWSWRTGGLTLHTASLSKNLEQSCLKWP